MSDPVDPSRKPRPPVARLGAERERTIARLQDAVAADHLDLEELDERLDLAMRARNEGELQILLADLPTAMTIAPASTNLPAVIDTTRAAPAPHATTVKAVFSSAVKRGRRTMPRQMHAKSVFGSIVIDLREATFEPGVSTLDCKSVFGSIEVYVPRHVRLDVEGSGVFGSFEEHGHDSAADASPDAPVLRVRGKAVFGSVEARVGRTATEKKRAKKRLGAT